MDKPQRISTGRLESRLRVSELTLALWKAVPDDYNRSELLLALSDMSHSLLNNQVIEENL